MSERLEPDWLARLRQGCRVEGLNLVLPVDGARFDAAARGRGAPTLADCWPGARAAVVIADGGPTFFNRFVESRAQARGQGPLSGAPPATDPLDAFTTVRIDEIGRSVLGAAAPIGWRAFFPFAKSGPVLPFQQLGMAAGLPAPGPLGLQIHPTFGPWWAYRAVLLVTSSLPEALGTPGGASGAREPSEPSDDSSDSFDSCGPCSKPCVTACPAGAVTGAGFVFAACSERRLAESSPCARSCPARAACPVGAEARYAPAQIAFHMDASLVSVRRHATRHPRPTTLGT